MTNGRVVPERYHGYGLTSPFQVAMMMHLNDEVPLDDNYILEDSPDLPPWE